MTAPHTIPDHVAARVSRLVNEAEDMRQQAADDLKQIYADLREELKGMGWKGSAVSAEISALKGAISEMRLDDDKKAEREEKSERIGDYVSLLSRARAREGDLDTVEATQSVGAQDERVVTSSAGHDADESPAPHSQPPAPPPAGDSAGAASCPPQVSVPASITIDHRGIPDAGPMPEFLRRTAESEAG